MHFGFKYKKQTETKVGHIPIPLQYSAGSMLRNKYPTRLITNMLNEIKSATDE